MFLVGHPMTPTPEQIEAVADVLEVSYMNRAYALKMAERVLIAAAGVEPTCISPIDDKAAALTQAVAAGVGEQTSTKLPGDTDIYFRVATVEAVISDTIERCAQVAETCDFNSDGNDGTRRASIASAIRALKD
jgi:hypothetical protein